MESNIFIQVSTLLAITISIAFILRLFKQPLIVAYIVAGIVSGPLFLDLLNSKEEFFQTFAHFGIVLLLFIVGLSLNFEYIKKVGKSVFIGAIVQFFVTAILGFLVMQYFGFTETSSIFVAVAITFSSTIIVVKLLTEKEDAESIYGKYVIGILLIQDLLAVGIMIFLTTISMDGTWRDVMLIMVTKTVLLAGLVYFMSRYILPVLISKIAYSGEMLFIFTIAWCFGIASLVHLAGFTIEIGAIIAGVSLGASPYQGQIASRIRPLRDFFIVLFFIVLGSQMQLGNIGPVILPAITLSFFVLLIHPIVLYFIMRRMKYTRRNAILASITMTQISEFGFILVFKGRELGYLFGSEVTVLTAVALTTIIISSYLITYNEIIYQKLFPILDKFGKDRHKNKLEEEVPYKVWVFGFHRIGWKVCEALQNMGVSFAVVDFNPDAVVRLNRRGIPVFFGDAADVEFLETLPLAKAKLIISTIPEFDDQNTMISTVRQMGSKAIIIANLYQATHLDSVYRAGADYVMMPHLLGGSWMAHILQEKPWNRNTFKILREEQKREMRQRLDESAHV